MKMRQNKRTEEIRAIHAKGPQLPVNLDPYERLRHRLSLEIEEKIITGGQEFEINFDPHEGQWCVYGQFKFYPPLLRGLCVEQNWCVRFDDDELAFPVEVLNKIKDAYEAVEAKIMRAVKALRAEFKAEIAEELG